MGVGTDNVQIDRPLTNIALSFARTGGFIGRWFFPRVPVMKKSGLYYKFDPKRRAIANVNDARAPGAAANQIRRYLSTDNYDCSGKALSEPVTDEELFNNDTPVDPFIDAVETIMGQLQLAREKRAKAVLDAAITETSSPGTKWDNSGTPIADMKAKIQAIRAACGIQPNVIGMDMLVFEAIQDTADFQDRISGGANPDNPAIVQARHLADILNVPNIAIAGAYENTAQEGQTATVSEVWSDDVYIGYSRLQSPRIGMPSGGYELEWQLPQSGVREGFGVQRIREDKNHQTIVELNGYYDLKDSMPEAWASLTNVLT